MLVRDMAHSELTNRDEVCTVCPTLVSEIDGVVIVDGTPDCDLLAMHEFGFDHRDGAIPLELTDDEPMVMQASEKVIRKIAKRQRAIRKENMEKQIRNATKRRILDNEDRWEREECDDSEPIIGDINNPGVAAGLNRLFMDIMRPEIEN